MKFVLPEGINFNADRYMMARHRFWSGESVGAILNLAHCQPKQVCGVGIGGGSLL
jgi:hypothetical protein